MFALLSDRSLPVAAPGRSPALMRVEIHLVFVRH